MKYDFTKFYPKKTSHSKWQHVQNRHTSNDHFRPTPKHILEIVFLKHTTKISNLFGFDKNTDIQILFNLNALKLIIFNCNFSGSLPTRYMVLKINKLLMKHVIGCEIDKSNELPKRFIQLLSPRNLHKMSCSIYMVIKYYRRSSENCDLTTRTFEMSISANLHHCLLIENKHCCSMNRKHSEKYRC